VHMKIGQVLFVDLRFTRHIKYLGMPIHLITDVELAEMMSSNVFVFARHARVLFALLIYASSVGCSSSSSSRMVVHTYQGIFVPIASPMVQRRDFGVAVPLQDGRVLIAGGFANVSAPFPVELFDPGSQTFQSLGLSGLLEENGGVLLNDGAVLLVDGRGQAAVAFDPNSRLFKKVGAPVASREGYTITKLADGRVLLAGGSDFSTSTTLDSAEIYDPATGGFRLTGNLVNTRSSHVAALLPDGRVLLAGGGGANGVVAQDTAELFDPMTGMFTEAGHMTTPRVNFTATVLKGGKVLLAGGWPTDPTTVLLSAELYDPAAISFVEVGNMVQTHVFHTAVLLADGRVLISGGADDTSPAVIIHVTSSACIYDPNNESFMPTADMTVERRGHSMTLLRDGTVLVAGGNASAVAGASAELFK
jgi:hypothetical protein